MATEDQITPQGVLPPAPDGPPPEDGPDAAIVQCASLFLVVRRLLFTSLGALALTAEEAREFVDRLAERSESSQEVAQEEVERLVDDLHHPPALPTAHPHNGIDSPVDALWGRLRVPTRREIEDLSRKISALDQKLGELRKRRGAGPASPAAHSAPHPDA
jgi:polyhydroxyalkanoate synthesis regulator phasin